MAPFQKPENALKRAQELKELGKLDLALDVLHELITSRRHRSWTKVHEQIMIEYVNLCTEMKKGRLAKEGLHQYKNITGATALNSLETVINHYIKSAEERVESARSELDKVVLDFDDLEASETPESLLLMMVSAEDSKDRTDRAVLTPWLKFLWEAYRTVLDILRNNSKLEMLYQKTAKGALQFCLKYERKAEFRRLCDLLRYHLQQVLKYQNQAFAINLNAPESLQAHLETRFEQLNVASKLELWQEAFKAIEDISYLMEISNKSPRPQMLATYYSKLSMVFWRSNQCLFHAQSLLKLFQLSKEQKRNFSPEEASSLASAVLLAVLVCPLQASEGSMASQVHINELGVAEQLTDRNLRLSVLVGVDTVPTRDGLITEMNSLNILQYADPSLLQLHSLVETQFLPLQLCKKIQPLLVALEANDKLAQYVAPLKDIVVLRLLKQLSQVYSSMKLSRLSQLISFFTDFEIENFILRSVKSRALQVRLCHRTRSISFATNVFVVESNESALEGPQLQSLQSQMMSNQLSTLSRRLRDAVEMIDPALSQKLVAARRTAVYEGISRKITEEHGQIMERKEYIERFLETLEQENQARREAEQKKREEMQAEARRLEGERMKAEVERRERERKEKELADMNKAKALEKIENMKKTAVGARLLADINLDELEGVDPDEVIRLQLDKEQREQQAKLKAQERKIDYFERAKHKEEIPLRVEHNQKLAVERVEAHRAAQITGLEAAKKQFAVFRELRDQMIPLVAQKNKFVEKIMAERKKIFDAAMAERKKVEEAIRAEEDRREQARRAKAEAEAAAAAAKLAEQERLRDEEQASRNSSRGFRGDSAPGGGDDRFRTREGGAWQQRDGSDRPPRAEDNTPSNWRVRDDSAPARPPPRRDDGPARSEEGDRAPRTEAYRPSRREEGAPRAARGEEGAPAAAAAPSTSVSAAAAAAPTGSAGVYRPTRRDDGPTRSEESSASTDRPPRSAESSAATYRPTRRDDGPPRSEEGSASTYRPTRRDDGPVRGEESSSTYRPTRRDDGPSRRDDGPPRRDDSGPSDWRVRREGAGGPPPREAGYPRRDEESSYRPARRDDDAGSSGWRARDSGAPPRGDASSSSGAYRPRPRDDSGPSEWRGASRRDDDRPAPRAAAGGDSASGESWRPRREGGDRAPDSGPPRDAPPHQADAPRGDAPASQGDAGWTQVKGK